ncbi:MAG: hypothetical protein P9F19_11100 [Candidatus Contendobacter sp.]|nr:hypothetical protein [Candidatus Contendobacter sp.]MDG4557915.1 hypothetical protein [Candidatus Contendobacter sp.]
MIEVNPKGLERIRADFARLVPETQRQVVRGLADVAFATAQDQVDTHTKTGALARSLRLQSDGDGGWIIGHDQQMAPHAVFVHWGTRPHEIRPKNKKVLRWVGEKGATTRNAQGRFVSGTKFVFARFVHHPGYAGDAWLVKAADEAVRQFDAVVRRVQPPTS